MPGTDKQMTNNETRSPAARKKGGVGRWKISSQLIMVYCLAVFLPLIIIGSVLISTVTNNQKKYYSDLLAANNDGVRQTIYEITTQIFTISDSIVYNDSLIRFLTGEYENQQEMFAAASKTTLLDKYAAKYAGVDGIYVYIDREDMVDYGQFHKVTDEIRETEWYRKASEQYIPFWMAYESVDSRNTNKDWNLVLVRKMVLVGGEHEAVIMIKVRNSYLSSRLTNSKYTTMISIDDQPVAFGSLQSLVGTKPEIEIDYDDKFFYYRGETVYNGRDSLVCVNTLNLSRSANKLYLVSYDTDAMENVRRLARTSWLILAAALILPLIIISVFTHRFTAQVRGLRDEMGKASRGEYREMKEEMRGSEELAEAFEDLCKMVHDIQRMEAEQYEAQIRAQNIRNDQQKIEFKMLSSQINPHFLYNTLETIRMKALAAGDTEVANATRLLGKSMRYVLENTGTKDTTLQKELDHLKVYLQIQQLRFGDRVNYEIKVQEGLKPDEFRMLALLLQPVAENAIVHGLESRETDGMVLIDVRTEGDRLIIEISDNGDGIGEAELAELKERLGSYESEDRTNSIGLYNVNRRIKLSYGTEYGVGIESEKGKGTCVSVVIPQLKA
ncbi:MAG: sensor histidine kinase [Lachnospiraceae bacterium]|nr:sensor histidine kinase [Lachnospiraceae bacterium]